MPRTLLLAAALLAIACAAAAQTPPPPAEKSVDQLIRELKAVQAERAELEKIEGDLRAAVRKKLDELSREVDKLGAGPGAGKAEGPDAAELGERFGSPYRVGRVVVEGAANRKGELTAREILGKVGLNPGQPYRRRALDQAQKVMEQIGLTGVALEAAPVAPNGPGEERMDIRVRFAPEVDR